MVIDLLFKGCLAMFSGIVVFGCDAVVLLRLLICGAV